MDLNNKELVRYSRQLILPEIGADGQQKLKEAKVLLVGTGGLGSPVAIYLAATGVGTLGIVDSDNVDLSNLHRQVIHFTRDIGKSKVLSAKEKIAHLNPHVKVIPYKEQFSEANALKLLKDYDLVVDGTDNFPTRYLINDACVLSGKPFVFGGIFRFEGQCCVFGLEDGPCYRCFLTEPPKPDEIPSCAEAGVLGLLPGIIGLLQANEAVKIICGIGQPLKGRLLIFDALQTQFREINIRKDPQCPLCGEKRTIHKVVAYADACCPTPSNREDRVSEITVQQLKRIMDNPSSPYYLLDVREPKEWAIAHIEGAVLKPFSTFKNNYADIPKDKKIYIHCKVGGRSLKAAQFLKTKGYRQVFNVKGGIDAWAKEIDPAMPKY